MNQKTIPVEFVSKSDGSNARVKDIHDSHELSKLIDWYMKENPDRKISIVINVKGA
ncbi:MAG: hypothetical protein IT569_07445 [Leptospiraceae bacterium]|nr:hypothetical protein [Leptospiraceae bacterium]